MVAKYLPQLDPPLLQLWVHDAPHRRMHVKVIEQYRKVLYKAVLRANALPPIKHPIDLDVLFVNGASPDLGNLYLALEQALDGMTLTKPGIVKDDSLIQKVTMAKFFPEGER